MLRHINTVDQVVRVHEGASFGLFDRGFECREINLTQRALVYVGTMVHSAILHIVRDEMLDGSNDALALDSFDDGNSRARGKVGIFPKVFEISPIHRSAI